MLIKIFIFLVSLSLFASANLTKKEKNKLISLQKVDWRNFQYVPAWIKLKDGKSEIHEYYKMGQPHDTIIWTLKEVCYGDINNDKIEDALIIIEEINDNYRAKKYYKQLRKYFYTIKNDKLTKLEIKKTEGINTENLQCFNSKNKKIKRLSIDELDWNNFKPLKLVNGKIFIKNLSDYKTNGRTARSLSLFRVCYGDFNNDKIKDAVVFIQYSLFHSSGQFNQYMNKYFYTIKANKIIEIKLPPQKIDIKKLKCQKFKK